MNGVVTMMVVAEDIVVKRWWDLQRYVNQTYNTRRNVTLRSSKVRHC